MNDIYLETIQSISPSEHGLSTYIILLSLLQYLGNSLDYEGFQQMIKDVLAERQEALLKKNNLSINIDPRIASIFQSPTIIASK